MLDKEKARLHDIYHKHVVTGIGASAYGIELGKCEICGADFFRQVYSTSGGEWYRVAPCGVEAWYDCSRSYYGNESDGAKIKREAIRLNECWIAAMVGKWTEA